MNVLVADDQNDDDDDDDDDDNDDGGSGGGINNLMTSDNVMSQAMGLVNQMGMGQWLSAFTGGAGNPTASSGYFINVTSWWM